MVEQKRFESMLLVALDAHLTQFGIINDKLKTQDMKLDVIIAKLNK